MDTKNAEFTGQRDTWNNSQDKEETIKANSAIVLKSATASRNVRLPPLTQKRERLSMQTNQHEKQENC